MDAAIAIAWYGGLLGIIGVQVRGAPDMKRIVNGPDRAAVVMASSCPWTEPVYSGRRVENVKLNQDSLSRPGLAIVITILRYAA